MSPDNTTNRDGDSREEHGSDSGSHRHPPHDTDAGSPALPSNAHGDDTFSTEEGSAPIDDESMYDRRPSEDKDQPPSEDAGK
jgi:hypothetical protein